MTACVLCQERERDLENNLLTCPRCAGRLTGALRRIPELVDELYGLGFVERDTRPGTRAVRIDKEIARVPAMADPAANLWPAGPLNGSTSAPRVSGSPGRSTPIRIDPTDLLAHPRHGSIAVAARSPWPEDQVGHLPVASVLDFWVRDWADLRGERPPDLRTRERSPVEVLTGWLLDRLDWALRHHLALDEFARDVSDLLGALWGLAGHGAARPKLMEAACPSCSLLTLIQPYPDASIECTTTDCQRIITPEEYAEWVRTLINETTAG